jgi:exopolyphosphatase / guanosine-5'-triphosphate,3'-diphosphate pyrophosphatase
MHVAVVDLGTNTTRLLVADVSDGAVTELARRGDVTRLGEGVDRSGRLADGAIERVVRALEDYDRLISEHGVERRIAVATSAVREASNGDDFRGLLHERFGLDARIISGDEEARLTFLGATHERPRGGDPVLVLDIGGGSTEFVVGVPGEDPTFHVSTRAGSVRQTERHLADDPPSQEQLDELEAALRAIIIASVPEEARSNVVAGIAVAGTATSLAAIDQDLDPVDPAKIHGYRLTLAACERMLDRLASIPLGERRNVRGLHPDRAPTIVAGAAILVESMRCCGLDSIEVSEADLLHGCALEAASDKI